MSEHIHHSHSEGQGAFPADEENFVLILAQRAQAGKLPFDKEPSSLHEEEADLTMVIERLGDTFPDLNDDALKAVEQAFNAGYNSLPTSHPRYSHGHSHDHDHSDHHGCGKIHGPLRQRFERFEQKVLGKISNTHAKGLAAAAFRLGALSVCPGDDIAAIGMQVYGSVSGQVSDGEYHEEQAILPRRPRIDLRGGRAFLPLDMVASHRDLSGTKVESLAESLTDDNGSEQKVLRHERLAKEAARAPERRRFLRRVSALGAAALSALAIGSSGVNETMPQKSKLAVLESPAKSQEPSKPRSVQKPKLTNYVVARKGDSQWKLAENSVRNATGSTSLPIVNAATAYTAHLNRESHPNPHQIDVGDRLFIPSKIVIKQMQGAVEERPDSELATYIETLNAQASYLSEESQETLRRIDKYLST